MKTIALLSGGLDSAVSMLIARQQSQIILALTFDYGQKAKTNEIRASQNICRQYNIDHKIIKLPFMDDMQSALIQAGGITTFNSWVPNRNGLFLNLAACYAENLEAKWICCGFNSEEAVNFSDNTMEYVEALNRAFFYSTRNHVQAVSFVQQMDKIKIIEKALDLKIDLRQVWSCYREGARPCGECPSCQVNQAAFKKVGVEYIGDFIY